MNENEMAQVVADMLELFDPADPDTPRLKSAVSDDNRVYVSMDDGSSFRVVVERV